VLGSKVKQQGRTAFVGGLSTPSGSVAASAMDYRSARFGGGDDGGVRARKAWSFQPRASLSLSADMHLSVRNNSCGRMRLRARSVESCA
jgi:hypothetical protein